MSAFRYTLERYQGSKTKHHCPQCGKKTLTKYIDSETSEYVSDHVGRCDRESNCGYHYKPSQFFQDSGEGVRKDVFKATLPSLATLKVFIPSEILKKSRTGYHKNSFVQHLLTLFDEATVSELVSAYHIGTSDGRWPGSCLFWFIDARGRIHAGQIKLFTEGHTASYESPEGSKKCTTWIHSILKEKLSPRPEWLTQYLEQEKKVSCIFGEHLIPKSSKPFAIVEAPATAIVASAYLPQYTWLAIGSLSYLTPGRCEVLKGKKVVLYPDLGAFENWKAKGDALGFYCSSLLEEHATAEDKARGLDLRDYLERFNVSEFLKPDQQEFDLSGNPINEKGYPVTWDHGSSPNETTFQMVIHH